jgi:hypothetical protein
VSERARDAWDGDECWSAESKGREARLGERETEKGGREREGGQRSSCGNNMTVSLDQLNVLSLSPISWVRSTIHWQCKKKDIS